MGGYGVCIRDENVADVIAGLTGLAEKAGVTLTGIGPRDTTLRTAQSCYNHLAGNMRGSCVEINA